MTVAPLPTHGRFDFSPIAARPDYSWPGAKRLALWVALGVTFLVASLSEAGAVVERRAAARSRASVTP